MCSHTISRIKVYAYIFSGLWVNVQSFHHFLCQLSLIIHLGAHLHTFGRFSSVFCWVCAINELLIWSIRVAIVFFFFFYVVSSVADRSFSTNIKEISWCLLYYIGQEKATTRGIHGFDTLSRLGYFCILGRYCVDFLAAL